MDSGSMYWFSQGKGCFGKENLNKSNSWIGAYGYTVHPNALTLIHMSIILHSAHTLYNEVNTPGVIELARDGQFDA